MSINRAPVGSVSEARDSGEEGSEGRSSRVESAAQDGAAAATADALGAR
jgi:hypothetical protein